MMVSGKKVRNTQDALEVRLRIAQVSGAPRNYRAPQRAPQSQPAKLILVKGNRVTPAAAATLAPTQPMQTMRRRPAHKTAGHRGVIKMPLKRTEKQNDLLLGSMAAFGPLVWIGHALLVWLKLV